MPKFGLIITRDLFFASKATGTASALGQTVQSVGTWDAFQNAAAKGELGLLILDLDCPDVSPHDVIAALPTDACITTIAFGPHVHEERLAAARQAGFQQVMPRSRFSATLPEILRAALGGA
jgi:DNA-binding NarL/FixJ family response regulator